MKNNKRLYLALLLALNVTIAHSESGVGSDQYQEGLQYYAGQGRQANYALAFDKFKQAAADGSSEAMDMMGVMLIDGIGVRSDIAGGERWLKKACNQGYAPSCTNLALSFERKDPVMYEAQARKWYHKAIDLGYPRAKYHLARMILSHPGDDFRTYGLTLMSEAGLAGVDEAVKALRRLSVAGVPSQATQVAANNSTANTEAPGAPTQEAIPINTTATIVAQPDNLVSVFDEVDSLKEETTSINHRAEVSAEKMELSFNQQIEKLREEMGDSQREEITYVIQSIDALDEKVRALERRTSEVTVGLERIEGIESRWERLIAAAERPRDEDQAPANTESALWAQEKNQLGLNALRHNDHMVAMTMFQMAAATNLPAAINNLGYCYHHGLGTVANPYKARRLYEQAVALEDTTAMFNLGQLLRAGIGGPPDIDRGNGLLLKAGDLGNKSAALAVGTEYLLDY